MEPVSEKRTVIDHVLYKVDVWYKGEQIELAARSRLALSGLINQFRYDSFGRAAGSYNSDLEVGGSGIYRDVLDTETDIEGEVLGVYLQDSANGYSKISAIKRYRELTSLGLKESKDAVEEILAKHGYQ